MSDPSGRTLPFAGWGEPPVETTVEPPESGVRVVRREESERVAVELSPEQLSQLALQFAAAVGQPEKPPLERPMFGELADAWLAKVQPLRVAPDAEARLVRHLLPLFLDDEETLTAAGIEEALHALAPTLSASSRNKVLGAGRKVVDEALRARRWHSANPFKLVRRAKETRPKYELLDLAELGAVQAKLPAHRRPLFRIALHLGLRTGELLALRREDVDFKRGVVLVHRSHGRDQTKTGRERTVPIVPAVAGDLLHAVEGAPGELVFGGEGGERQRADTKLTRVLRTAMAAALVGVVSITYKCRRCGHVEVGGPPVALGHRCSCGFAFWPVPEVRRVRWYDLRHMAATFHHRAGADPLCVSLALGHSVHGTTQGIYTHPSDEMMRRELSKWRLPG